MTIRSQFLKFALGGTLALSGLTPALATTLGFEDIATPVACCTFLPARYHGFVWSGSNGSGSWVIAEVSADLFPGVEAHSGQNFAWSNGASDLSIDGGGTFDLESFWVRIGHQTAGGAVAHGFLGSIELYTLPLSLTDAHQFVALNFFGIDRFMLTDQDNSVLIDDITINATPEPMTILLVAVAGLLAAGSRRRVPPDAS